VDGTDRPSARPRRPGDLNAFAKRWVRSAKEECLSKLILFGEGPLSRTLPEFSAHYHGERNHQGKGNNLLFRMLPINRTARPRRLVSLAARRTAHVSMPRPHEFFDHTQNEAIPDAYARARALTVSASALKPKTPERPRILSSSFSRKRPSTWPPNAEAALGSHKSRIRAPSLGPRPIASLANWALASPNQPTVSRGN